jgi:hypothetical protein
MQALAVLKEELTHAAAMRDDGGVTRDGVIEAITSLDKFLSVIGWTDQLAPVSVLSLALQGLDEGVVTPLLRPRPISNKPPASHIRRHFRGICQSDMMFLMSRGANKEDAARFVAGVLRQAGVQVKGKKTNTAPWEALVGWLAEKSRDSKEAELQRGISQSVYPDNLALPDAKAAVRKSLLSLIASVGSRELNG